MEITAISARVTPAVTGAAEVAASAGTSFSLRKMIGPRVTGISISTVPATVGVKIFLNSEELCRQKELAQGGDDDQAGHQAPASPFQRRHADGQEGAAAPHEQEVAGADSADASGLDHRGDSTDHQRCKHGPYQIGFVAPRGSNQDRRRQHDAGGRQRGVLQPEPNGERKRRSSSGS